MKLFVLHWNSGMKKINFVTLFDSLYLPQALSLHASMQRNMKFYTLWMLCVDDSSYLAVETLKLPNVSLIKLSEFETDELKEVKKLRTKGEYCWTLTPFSIGFVFEIDKSVDEVTYVDADIWFRKSPDKIFEEFYLSKKSVMITDHGFSPEYDLSSITGQYCVQFMIFKRGEGEVVRKHWEKSCLDWCYDRFEGGKFGDQKYLDYWESLFPEKIHVLNNVELCLAPWNALRYPHGNSIFYHFHGLKIVSPKKVFLSSYPLPNVLIRYVYRPYLMDMRSSINKLKMIDFPIVMQGSLLSIPQKIKHILIKLKLRFFYYFSSNTTSF